nr:D-(-)-3-hydroxybutyrate oligomer hydrolase [Marinobacter salinus]
MTSADETVQFRADLTDSERADFSASWPDRFAWKHAHSKANPEADWGLHVLQSIEFGFYVLNAKFGRELGNGETLITITPKNTLVIASSVSNGGGSSVRAAEQDKHDLIDGVAVSEPNVNPEVDTGFSIRQGDGPVISNHSRSLLDYTTALAVWQGCANQAPAIRDDAPLNGVFNPPAIGENICNSLANKGLVSGATLDDRATDALRMLNEEFAIQPEQNLLAPVHFGLAVAQSISMTYANAYGRAAVEARLCDLSLAATDGAGAFQPLPAGAEAALFSASNGIPPTAGVNIVYDGAEGQPTHLAASVSPSSSQPDYGLDALLCLRSLAQDSNAVTGAPLEGEEAVRADAIAGGMNGFPGVADRYVPLHHYYFQALDLVWATLKNKQPLPPSQVVRTLPRGDIGTPLSEANLPDIDPDPESGDRIVFVNNQLRIPE